MKKLFKLGNKLYLKGAYCHKFMDNLDISKIRNESRIIVSNPYEVHHILAWHYKWQHFFSNLKFIVLDEAHMYRGVFGSNVSLVIFANMQNLSMLKGLG